MKKVVELLKYSCSIVILWVVAWILILLLQPKGIIGIRYAHNKNNEACIKQLYRGMPAEQAGLQVDDCIVSVNGKKIKHGDNLQHVNFIVRGKPNTNVTLEIKRDNEILKYEITRTKAPKGIDWLFFDRKR